MDYFFACAHEQFPPDDLLKQAVEAEKAGFDGIECSDHFQPWWEPGESGHAWVWLGAVGQATKRIPIGTGVTAPIYRHNPAVVAQAFMTLEAMFPGRAFVGIGSGESLNESPCGMDWPSVGEQIERMEEALEIINALFACAHVDHEGKYFKTKRAYLHTRAERRPPIYVSAFGPKAAAVAGRLGDGLWTLADPERAPDIVDAYRGAAEDAGREPGEVLLQTSFSWAADDDAALEGVRPWKGSQPQVFYKDDWHRPKEMYEEGERQVSDEEFKESAIISSDPGEHAERIREVEKLGASIVVLANNSGADPHAAIEVYANDVLPALRGAPVPG